MVEVFFHLFYNLGHPVGIVHSAMTVDETHRLIFQRPVVIVLVAQVGGQSRGGGITLES